MQILIGIEVQAFKFMAVEESSLSLCLSGVQQERLFTLLSLPLCLSTAGGWLFPPFQLLSASKERIFLIFSTRKGCCQAEGRPIQMLPLHVFHVLKIRKWRQREGKPGCALGSNPDFLDRYLWHLSFFLGKQKKMLVLKSFNNFSSGGVS